LNKEYYNAKSFLLFKLNRYKESLEALDNVIDIYPNDTSLLNNRTVMLAHFAKTLKENEKKEDYEKAKEKAIATGEKLISLAPKVGNFYDSYGEMLMMFEEYEDAIEQLKKALTLEPHGWFTFDTYSKMGNCYKELDEIEKAIESYEKAKLLSERMLPERRTGYISKTINFEKEIKNLKRQLKEKSKNKTA
ncbi:MAG: tetratricopeptide repeat protein, partial [Promethearchaeota archaeon]